MEKMKDVLSCSCGGCREYVVLLQDTITVAALDCEEL